MERGMLSAIIHAGNDAERLARTIGSLVPAIAEGIVGDGHVLAPSLTGEMELVADAAGCNVVNGNGREALAEAVRRARGEHVLFLPAGSVLENGWWVEAAQFIKQSAGAGGRMEAVFTHAAQEYGLGAAAHAAMRGIAARLAKRPMPGQGLIAHRRSVEGRIARGSGEFPPRPAGRLVFLRAKAFVVWPG
jgi:hypothetical protein